MLSVQCTVNSVHFILYTVQNTLYAANYKVFSMVQLVVTPHTVPYAAKFSSLRSGSSSSSGHGNRKQAFWQRTADTEADEDVT